MELTPDRLRRDVADVLDEDPANIGEDDDLLERGMDSIRLMHVAERWRDSGVELDFVDLADNPTLSGWWDLVSSRRP